MRGREERKPVERPHPSAGAAAGRPTPFRALTTLIVVAALTWSGLSCATRTDDARDLTAHEALPPTEPITTRAPVPVEPLTGQEDFDRARSLLLYDRTEEARRFLEKLLNERNVKPLLRDRAAFLLAVLAFQRPDPHRTLSYLDAVSSNYRRLPDYQMWYRANALAALGEMDAAREALGDLLLSYPDSIWKTPAAYRLVEFYYLDRNLGSAGTFAEALIADNPDPRSYRAQSPAVALDLLAKVFVESGRSEQALPLLEQLWSEYPASEPARGVDERIAGLREVLGLPEFTAEPRQWLSRVRGYEKAGKTEIAFSELMKLLDQLRPERDGAAREDYIQGLMQKGRLYEALGKTDRARGLYVGAIRAGFDDEGTFRARLARIEARVSNRKAIQEHLLLVKHNRSSELAAESLYTAARLAQISGNEELARSLFARLFDEYPRSKWVAFARFNLGWIAYREGNYEQAVAEFEHVATNHEDQIEEVLRALYWSGRATEHIGGLEAAEPYYERLLNEHAAAYYSMLAIGRLEGRTAEDLLLAAGSKDDERVRYKMASTDPALATSEAQLLKAVASLKKAKLQPAVVAAGELIAIGLADEAEAELDRAAWANRDDSATMARLIGLFERATAWRDAQRWAYYLNGARPRIVDEESLPFWRTLYPLAFAPYVRDYALRNGLDPHLVLAIMREESHFDPQITSWADARGLMQIIPPTGELIARAHKVEDFDASQLYDPETNIRFGTYYLSNLIDRFEGNPVLAIASYNGGPHNVDRWRREFGNLELDVFIEEIPFHETRNYVKKVTRSWALYKAIYRNTDRPPRLRVALHGGEQSGEDAHASRDSESEEAIR